MAQKSALITGITGQDGSYLAELLLSKGYTVHGLVRRSSTSNYQRLEHLLSHPQLSLHEGDLTDSPSVQRIIQMTRPDEIYNLGAMSHVKISFDTPEYTANVDGIGVLRLLEAMREYCPHSRFYQASTSELFGKVQEVPQSEKTPFYPRSPYGVAKLYGYWAVVNYREAYDLYACNGILFNHESPRRGTNFVSKKITLAAARISLGLQDSLILGNLNAQRDWGFAKDFVEGMWLMLQQETPDDFVLATGKTTTVRDFVKMSFHYAGINLLFEGEGVDEKGIDAATGKVVVSVSPEFFRPTEVELLIGDATKAKTKLGWESSTSVEELAQIMVQADLSEQTLLCEASSRL